MGHFFIFYFFNLIQHFSFLDGGGGCVSVPPTCSRLHVLADSIMFLFLSLRPT